MTSASQKVEHLLGGALLRGGGALLRVTPRLLARPIAERDVLIGQPMAARHAGGRELDGAARPH